MSKLSTDSYKGVRDFYPRDKFIHDYIVNTWSDVCERFGYESYDASILEPAELYKAKGAENEEMVNDQTYTFEDRGGREVTLRPEMTPTVARMVAGKSRELTFPLRWYSIPNLFRYERAQRGRLREHWQLNADIFGIVGREAEVEIIALAHAILTTFGAQENDFEIRVNDRRVFEAIFNDVAIDKDARKSVMSLLDRRAKIDNFEEELGKIVTDKTSSLLGKLNSAATSPVLEELRTALAERGVTNVVIDTSIVRGFDYYTGTIFEIFDTSGENKRSMLGGGRYDQLLAMFDIETIPTVGFGMGDVTMRDFLETHDLLPEYISPTDIMLCVLEESSTTYADQVAGVLRRAGMNVAINYSYKKAGDQVKAADKKGIPFAACIGAQERESGTMAVKHLSTHEEKELTVDDIADFIFTQSE